jgi:hypothetical protein
MCRLRRRHRAPQWPRLPTLRIHRQWTRLWTPPTCLPKSQLSCRLRSPHLPRHPLRLNTPLGFPPVTPPSILPHCRRQRMSHRSRPPTRRRKTRLRNPHMRQRRSRLRNPLSRQPSTPRRCRRRRQPRSPPRFRPRPRRTCLRLRRRTFLAHRRLRHQRITRHTSRRRLPRRSRPMSRLLSRLPPRPSPRRRCRLRNRLRPRQSSPPPNRLVHRPMFPPSNLQPRPRLVTRPLCRHQLPPISPHQLQHTSRPRCRRHRRHGLRPKNRRLRRHTPRSGWSAPRWRPSTAPLR